MQLVTSAEATNRPNLCNSETYTLLRVTLSLVFRFGQRNNTESKQNLYKNTGDVIQQISELKASPEQHFARLDIEEFFVSGEPEFLVVDAAGLSNECLRKRLIHDVDRFLLE